MNNELMVFSYLTERCQRVTVDTKRSGYFQLSADGVPSF